MMKEDNHIFLGMQRDAAMSRQKSEFLWDAHNIRLTNREDSTLLAITNEKGTLDTGLTFSEFYVGHCVLGKYLVVFTATEDDGYSYIYRVDKTKNGYRKITLFEGYLGLSPHSPILAIGYYETELVLKVYWVDGVNQPRMINIAKPELKIPGNYIVDGLNLSGPVFCATDLDIDDYFKANWRQGLYKDTSFDFSQELSLKEQVDVIKTYGQGNFSPGVIQYALSYYNKYGQESNICYISPLYYISPRTRGGSPEEKVACSFRLQVWGYDGNFDYMRIYSIHRTSLDATPSVKIVADVSTNIEDPGEGLTYTDTGVEGSYIDPTLLLFVGGKSIVPNCIAVKDGTMFFGGYKINNQDQLARIKEAMSDWEPDDWTTLINHGGTNINGTYYEYTPDLSNQNSAGFKCMETYRCGIQVQFSNGEWSEPIHLMDNTLTEMYPWESYPERVTKAITILGDNLGGTLLNLGARKLRTCIVLPKYSKREVLCQGVLCPTLHKADATWQYNSSWFFRPDAKTPSISGDADALGGASIPFTHNSSLSTGATRSAEIQGMQVASLNNNTLDGGGNGYIVDRNVVTFHSPDIEFDTNLLNTDLEGVKLRIIGVALLGAIYGDINIQTSTPGIAGGGEVHNVVGYLTNDHSLINGGLVSGMFYQDKAVTKKSDGTYSHDNSVHYWLIHPWQRSGSLNNDERRGEDKGSRSAVLSKKKISNLKFFNKNASLGIGFMEYDISTPQVFSSDLMKLVKVSPNWLGKELSYLGNVDTMITSSSKYPIYQCNGFSGNILLVSSTDAITSSDDPVRIKYKSSPHMVFSLGTGQSTIELLPMHQSIGGSTTSTFTPPIWMWPEGQTRREIYDGELYLYSSEVITDTTLSDTVAGKYAIGKWYNRNVGTTGTSLMVARKNYRGNLQWQTAATGNNGIILKASGTIIQPNSHYLPGTTSSSYTTRGNQTTFRGTKYYKVVLSVGSTPQITDVTSDYSGTTPTSPTFTLSQLQFGEASDDNSTAPYLLIGELVRDVTNKFDGDAETNTEDMWIPSGNPVEIRKGANTITVPFEFGDTWYARYDCLKTYPFTQEDENQVVEIGSFLCETRINIDGRYDRNRGQLSNLNITPLNFNLLNEVYSQKDNFFNYRILSQDYYKQSRFDNQITWSKEKLAGSDVDTWTNVTLANTLDANGLSGSITSIQTMNDLLLCFLEHSVSQILFNSRALIPVSDGVPIEISNGYKVDGMRVINQNIGCQDKASIVSGELGLYFIDNCTDTIYLFNGELNNLSASSGMTWWVKDNHALHIWDPMETVRLKNGVRLFFDPIYKDIYFSPGVDYGLPQRDALCYSEQLRLFTSLMSYGGVLGMFLFGDGFFSLKTRPSGGVKLYENFKGKHNDFFGEFKGWDFSFVSNLDPTYTKVFDTIEVRADHWSTYPADELLTSSPINKIDVQNEYQSASATFNNTNMRRKFRIWRGLIPRSSKVALLGVNIDRTVLARSRIRNPWTIIKLGWTLPNNNPQGQEQLSEASRKAIVHDVSVKYTI